MYLVFYVLEYGANTGGIEQQIRYLMPPFLCTSSSMLLSSYISISVILPLNLKGHCAAHSKTWWSLCCIYSQIFFLSWFTEKDLCLTCILRIYLHELLHMFYSERISEFMIILMTVLYLLLPASVKPETIYINCLSEMSFLKKKTAVCRITIRGWVYHTERAGRIIAETWVSSFSAGLKFLGWAFFLMVSVLDSHYV